MLINRCNEKEVFICVFPARWPEKSLGSLGFCFWRVILDFVIIVFGAAAMFAGTVVSVFEIIDAFKLGTP